VLESLPEGLEETYRRILIAIDRRSSDARLVRRALVWLVSALRPMYMRELLEGLTIDPIRRALDPRFALIKGADLLDVCRSLVVHHEETDIITLSHMSVKVSLVYLLSCLHPTYWFIMQEYLVGELVYAKLPWYHIVLEDAHERLARLCMAYISFCLEEMKESRDRSSILTQERDLRLTTSYASRPLLKYVLSDGFSHLAHLGPGNAGIFKDIETLQTSTRRYTWEWDQMCKLVPSIHTSVPWPTSEHDFTFYALVVFAPDSLLQNFLCHTPLNPRDGTNPLVYTAHFGKTNHAKLLISHGADVNHRGLIVGLASDCLDADSISGDESDEDVPDGDNSDAHGSSDRSAIPLEVAVDHWNTMMVDLLLAEGSAVPARLLTRVLGERPHEFPLYIIRRLLQTAEFVKWTATPWDNRRLMEALVDDEEDYEQVELTSAIRKLVQVGCAETLLLVAVEKGCIPVVRTLFSVDRSSGSSHPNSESSTRKQRIDLLICGAAIVNALAANGDTPLHVAMRLSDENRCLVITKLLVIGGCSPFQFDADDKPPIHIAVARGFVSVVNYLLPRVAPLPSRILFTALQVTLPKRVEMIRLLISKGANVYVLNADGDTLLHVAMRSIDRSVCLEIVEILVDAGCNPSTCNLLGETPLHIAAKQGYFEVANYLLLFSTSSDVLSLLHPEASTQALTLRSLIRNTDGLLFAPEDEDRTFQAVRQFLDNQEKCLELAKCFVGAAGNLFAQSSGSAMLFDIAVIREFTRVVEYLVSAALPLPSRILFTALRHQPRMVHFLTSEGANLHSQEDNGDTLLHVAISTFREAQCYVAVEMLVKAGCPTCTVNAAGVQPIQIAVRRGFISLVKYLLPHPSHAEASLPPDLLFTALLLRHPSSMVRLLVDNGANVFYHTPDGDNLLHVVLKSSSEKRECLQITQMLVEARCSPFTPDAAGNTPLHIAIGRGFSSVVNYLLSRDVPLPSDILSYTLQLQHIFYWKSRHDWIVILTSLIRKGADLHTRDANGNTPMHYAMQLNTESLCLEITKILVDAGCSFSMPNSGGELPIRIAVGRALTTVIKHLLSQGALFPPDILVNALECDATHREILRMVSSLVRKGADVCVLAPNANTTLHVALANEKRWLRPPDDPSCLLDVVEILVQAGCDIGALCANGRTPLEVATAEGYLEVAEYLSSPGAKQPWLSPLSSPSPPPPEGSSTPRTTPPPLVLPSSLQ
jgi:ankyrin repeat protein